MQRHGIIGMLLAVTLLVSCAPTAVIERDTGIDLMNTDRAVYTLTNLRPDEVNARLYTLNYQREGFIPVCSEVRLDDRNKKRLRFKVLHSGRHYQLYRHKAYTDLPGYIAKHFGTRCPNTQALPELDRKGIERGKALVGMSKVAVIQALGYPPPHRTYSTDLDDWRYWINRFNTMVVTFDVDGRVKRIRH